MEWFKHSTGSHEDPDISDAWDQFGDAGPVIFWTILEVFGIEYSHLKDGWLTLSIPFFERKMRRKFKKTEKILEFFEKRERIFFKKDQTTISITIPKFIKIASNWTTRPHEKPSPAPTEAPTEAPTAKEEKKKRRRREEKNIYSVEFDSFWNEYPKKVGVDAAWSAWKKRNGDRPNIEAIIKAIEEQKRSDQWQKEKGQFIPNPATWINQGRWDDEITEAEDEMAKWIRESQEREAQRVKGSI
jgi:hypothetical protein